MRRRGCGVEVSVDARGRELTRWREKEACGGVGSSLLSGVAMGGSGTRSGVEGIAAEVERWRGSTRGSQMEEVTTSNRGGIGGVDRWCCSRT